MGSVRLALLVPILLTQAFGQSPGITITSPTDGTVVTPGESLSVVIAPVGATVIRAGAATFVPLVEFPPVIQSAPFQTTVQVPAGVVGPVTIAAFASDFQGDLLTATVSVVVNQSSQATAITVNPTVIPFASANSQPAFLSVFANFQNGTSGYVTTAPGITYTSSNTSVATVSATGQVQPVAAGQANITISFDGLSATVPVNVGVLRTSVTVGPSTTGPSVMLDGLVLNSIQTLNIAPGTTHTLSAVSPQPAGPGTQFTFAGWSDGGAATHAIIVPNTAVSYLASFNTQYQLTTSAGTGGTISPSPGFYNSGPITVTATPSTGYTFSGFTGALNGTTDPQTLTLSGPASVAASFTASQPILSITSMHTGAFAQGQSGATYSLTVSNAAGAPATAGAVTVTETLPAGLTLVSMSGTGWSCSASTCVRSDSLGAGTSYPAITVTVNVASNAPTQVTNQASVSGVGLATATASDPTVINAGNLQTQTITFGAIPAQIITKGTLTLTATASSGLTVTFTSNSPSVCTVAGSTVTYVSTGTCSITASQPGNANYSAATPVTQTFAVNPLHGSTPSSVTLTTSANPVEYGHAVTLTAAVTPSAATGSVTFFDGVTILGTGVLSGGKATFATSLLAFGPRSLRAFYVGDLTYAPSSALIAETVNTVAGSGFQPPKNYSGGAPFAVADLNGDGKPDVVFSDDQIELGVALGNGDGTFQSARSIGTGVTIFSVGNPIGVADFNGDGKPDIVCTGSSSAAVLLGNGDGTFQKPMLLATGGDSVVIADFNGDGYPDLALAGVAGVYTLLGIGDGTFQSPILNSEYFYAVESAIGGDFNGDGKADIAVGVIVFNGAGYLSVQLGNGDGTFQSAIAYPVPGYVTSGDFNGDGKLDLAVANGFVDPEADGLGGTVSLLLGNGDGTFQTPVSYPSGGMDAVATGDFNGDGKLDLIGPSASTSNMSLLLGNGDGTFQSYVYYVGTPSEAIAAADLNGDGRADVVLAGAVVLSAAPGATQTQTITFGAIPAQIIGNSPFTLNASASSGLPVQFASNSTSVCAVSGSTVTLVAIGTCSITATQPGNATIAAAEPVTVTFTIDPPFADLGDQTANEQAAIDLLASRGITTGCSTTPFDYCSDQPVTRGQMAVFIIRSIYGSNNFAYTQTPYFTDVPLGAQFYQYIQKMKDLGITTGETNTTYGPNDTVTRGEMAVFIIRARYGAGVAFNYSPTPYFTDVPLGAQFFQYIQKLRDVNITSGETATTYGPNDPVTRGEMALFVMRGAFNLLLPTGTPVLSTVSPSTGTAGNTVTVTVTGTNTNFAQGTTVVTAGNAITVQNVTVNSATSLTAQLVVASNATLGPVSLVATTGTQEAVAPNLFTITSDPATGIVAYFTGNNTTLDTTSGQSGTLVNGATYASGTSRTQGLQDAQAFSLNGTNSYVQAASSETTTLSGARTLIAWVYPNVFTGLGQPILTAGSTTAAADIFGISGTTGICSSDGQYQLYIDHAGTCFISDNSLIPDAWSLVAVTFDGSNIVFYINGVASVTVPSAQMFSYGLSTLEIGGNTLGGTSTGPSFNGLLSEVEVYDRALTPAEIQGIYAP